LEKIPALPEEMHRLDNRLWKTNEMIGFPTLRFLIASNETPLETAGLILN